MNNNIRLQVYLSRCGLGSRRKCENFISAGRISVNGEIISTLGTRIIKTDMVALDGINIIPVDKIYIALYKPVGYLCSNSDKFGRPLAGDLLSIENKKRLHHVGRLDFMSSGLIFFSNDGDFAYHIIHPSFAIEKEYLVTTDNSVQEQLLKQYLKGVIIQGIRYHLKKYQIISRTKIVLTLEEGKNREIRRVFKYYGMGVISIHRTRIGIVSIDGIQMGKYRYLTEQEISWFLKKMRKS